ncbi:MAG: NAD(P)H-binding protein [Oceanospirillum sp.]|nr:NAD(P)H-binding protein [Oceanospirillum sp.]
MGKTAIVIGATGVVGRALVTKLAASEAFDQVVTVTRRPDMASVADENARKVINHVVDFEQLDSARHLFQGDCLFSCLGTTLKQAGSVSAQRRVDLDYQLQAAQNASANGVSHYLLVSSSGANGKSASSYLKMKGELETQIADLPFKRISVFQPSLLLGERPDFRLGETLARWLMPALCWLPGLRRYRPIRGDQVAEKMLQVSLQPAEAVQPEVYTLDKVFPR